MKFIKINDKIKDYRAKGFEHGDRIIALLSNGDVKHGVLFFNEDYPTLFEVQLEINQVTGRSETLCDAMVCKVEMLGEQNEV